MSIDYLTTSTKISPRPMTNHSMGIINRTILIYGGNEESDYNTGKLWIYDIYWNSWLNINKSNKRQFNCYFSQIVVDDKYCYIIECKNRVVKNGDISISRIDSEKFVLDTLANLCYTCCNPNNVPDDVISMFHYCGALYIFSVIYSNPTSNKILRYSLTENSCSLVKQIGRLPQYIYDISGSVFEDRTDIFHYIHVFNLKTQEWTQEITYPDFDEYPSDRINTSISFTEMHGYVSGGKSKSYELLDDLWSIDLRTLKWHKFKFVSIKTTKNLKNKIERHTSFIYDNSTLFLFGGIIDNAKVNKLQKYMIEPPSLYNLGVSILLKNTKELSELKEVPIAIRKNIIPLKYELSTS